MQCNKLKFIGTKITQSSTTNFQSLKYACYYHYYYWFGGGFPTYFMIQQVQQNISSVNVMS